jgi:hypothetical protein
MTKGSSSSKKEKSTPVTKRLPDLPTATPENPVGS